MTTSSTTSLNADEQGSTTAPRKYASFDAVLLGYGFLVNVTDILWSQIGLMLSFINVTIPSAI